MLSTEEAVREHIRALTANEREAVVDGYADDAVILMAPKPIVGKAAIRALFMNLPEGGTPTDASTFIDHLLIEGEHALVVYSHPGVHGGDSFVVRNGKIVMQSVHLVND